MRNNHYPPVGSDDKGFHKDCGIDYMKEEVLSGVGDSRFAVLVSVGPGIDEHRAAIKILI